MAILNKDMIDDDAGAHERDRLNQRTEKIQEQALNRIKNNSKNVNYKLRNLFFMKKNTTDVIAAMDNDTFKTTERNVNIEGDSIDHVQAKNASGADVDTFVVFKKEFKWNQTADEMKKMLKDAIKNNPGKSGVEALKSIGILFQAGVAADISEEQIDTLAETIAAKFHFQGSPFIETFDDVGVNGFNKHLAADYANEFTKEELETILNPDGGGHGDLEKIEGKSKLHGLLTDAAKLETVGTTDPAKKLGGSEKMSYEDAVQELKNIEFDEVLISNDDSSKNGKSRGYKGKKPVDWSATTDVDKVDSRKNSRLSMLNTQKEDVIKLIEKYEKIGKHFEKIAKACKKAEVDFSSTGLKDYVAGDPPTFVAGRLDEKVDPTGLAKKLMKEFDLEEKGYEKELAEAKKHAEAHGDHHEGLSGADAVIAVFKAHIKKTEKCSDAEAEQLAYSLFVKNSIDASVTKNLEQTITEDILQQGLESEPNGLLGYFAKKGKELMYGNEHTYVTNLAKKAGVPYSMLLGEPDYSNVGYSKVITMYYALRDSVKEDQLTNSSFVRNQLLQLGHLLGTKFATDTLAEMNELKVEGDHGHGEHGEKKEGEGHAAHGPKNSKPKEIAKAISDLKTNTKLVLGADAPPPYDVEVRKCIDYAKENTAKYRRQIANGTKNLGLSMVGMGEWADNWKNPVSYPAWAAKNGAKYTMEHKASIGASTAFGTVAGAFILPGIGAPIGAALGAGIGAVAAKPIEAAGRQTKRFLSWFVTRPGDAGGNGHAAAEHH